MTDQIPDTALPDEPKHVETKAVILLVFLGLMICGFVFYVMYARGVFEPTQRLTLVADDSTGVIPGMDMTFAGFPIGRVRQVELADTGKVNILVDVQSKDAKWLRASSVFTLESSIVGETRLRAYTGVLTDAPLPAGSTRTVLRGDATAEIPRIVATARGLLENLETMTSSGSDVNTSLSNLSAVTGRMSGRYGVLGGALGGDEEAKKLMEALDRVNLILAKADQRVFGQAGVMDDAQTAVRQLDVVLKDASATLKKVDAVLVEAQAVGANTREATEDLSALRGDVDASLRKVNRLVEEINRKWPFARTNPEIKLP
ncbi:phospholipid/cholesterol/gamma-HCH transport system substrate-binding protein [Massilia aurea]|jgi:phospholipid/cholesterol/gamma-HCH transport system substrate-binding protein|uniref:Phospholipid/cholesterol/gamma-HCH transport system substrate-binding protein n=1 Tax=Massilia aurea TaxID=373040 RepID=A0A7X0CDS5_9BURK|nr:MlaD family protein [Massilia aurea]MBB6133573.1 phospholipid/cholesterol/gamma-HCH transport system substrate-binding protein [Massilia aurea]